MSYETLTIKLEDEETKSKLDVSTVKQNYEKLKEMHGKILSMSMNNDEKIIFRFNEHPVFQGFLYAYNNHYPITISPDIIWLLIVQSFAYHIGANAEKFRDRFVKGIEKHQITVELLDLNYYETTKDDWMNIFPFFINQIAQVTGGEIIDALSPDFTTADEVSMAVGQISIMSSFKHYFKHMFYIGGCGLPKVTIEGSIEDWEKIITKLEFMKEFDLDSWINDLIPILLNIIETKKGNVNENFWNQMIKIKNIKGEYKPDEVEGWITKFFLYDANGFIHDRPLTIQSKMASELLTVPFELNILKSETEEGKEFEKIDCEFVGGFVGMTQDEETFSLKPKIGWIIRKEQTKKKAFRTKPFVGWQ